MQAPSAKAVVSFIEVEDEPNSQREQCRARTSGADSAEAIMQSHRMEEGSARAGLTRLRNEATSSLASTGNNNTVHTSYYDNGVDHAGHCSYNTPGSPIVGQSRDSANNKTFQNCEAERTGNNPQHVSSEPNRQGKLSDYFLKQEADLRTEECFANEQRTEDISPRFGNRCLNLESRYDTHTDSEFQSIERPVDIYWNSGTNRSNHTGARPKENRCTKLLSNDQWDGKLDSSSNECSSSISRMISGPGSLSNLQDRKRHNGGCTGVIFPRNLLGISGENKPSHHAGPMRDPRQLDRKSEVDVSARANRLKTLEDDDFTNPLTRTNDAPLGDVAEGNDNHNTEIHTVVEAEVPQSPTSDVSFTDLWNQAPSNIEPFTEDRMQEGPKASGGLDVAGQNSHWHITDGRSQLGIPDSDCNSGDSSVDQDMRPSPEDAYSNSHSHGCTYKDILNNRSDDEPRNRNPLDSCYHEISLPDPDPQLHGGSALFSGNVGTRKLSPSIKSRDEMEDLQTSFEFSVESSHHNSSEPDHRTKSSQVSSRDTSNRQCSSGNMTGVRPQEFAADASGQTAGRSNNHAYTYYLSDGSNPSVSPSTRSRPLQRICERTWQPLETEAEPEISGPGRRCAVCRGVVQYLFRRGRREICENCFNEFERLKNQKSFSRISSEYQKVKRRCGHCSADRIQMNWLECPRCGCWLCSQCCMGSYNCIPKTF